MAKCTKEKELEIITDDKAGLLEEITGALAKGGVNIIALCGYVMDGKAHILIVSNDERRAKQAAEAQGWGTKENDVAVIEIHNEVGAGHAIAQKLKAANINIRHCYGSTSFTVSDCPCALVVKCDTPDAVIAAVS